MNQLIFAHRGASKKAPENTMAAFELAYQMGADGIETDVQLTKDQIPVLIHDETLRRTTNGTGFVQDYTFNELQKLDAGSWHSKSYQNERIPSLEAFLKWSKDKEIQLNIELKNNVLEYNEIESKVIYLIDKYKLTQKTTISTFNEKSLRTICNNHPTIETAFLISSKIRDLYTHATELSVRGIHMKYHLLTKNFIKNAEKHDLYIGTYTVNHPILIKRMMRLGCRVIITDVPDIAKKVINT